MSGIEQKSDRRVRHAAIGMFLGKPHELICDPAKWIQLKGMFSSDVGGGQAVMRDFVTGVNYGASDPRKDGQAVAELP